MMKKNITTLILFIFLANSTFCQAAIPFTVGQLIKKYPFISFILFISGTWFVYNINKRLKKSFKEFNKEKFFKAAEKSDIFVIKTLLNGNPHLLHAKKLYEMKVRKRHHLL